METDEYAFNGDTRKLSLKEQAILNDKILEDLALYAVTNGYTTICKDPRLIQNKFVELKMLVKRGTFTMEQLENHLGNVYGIVENEPNPEFSFLDE